MRGMGDRPAAFRGVWPPQCRRAGIQFPTRRCGGPHQAFVGQVSGRCAFFSQCAQGGFRCACGICLRSLAERSLFGPDVIRFALLKRSCSVIPSRRNGLREDGKVRDKWALLIAPGACACRSSCPVTQRRSSHAPRGNDDAVLSRLEQRWTSRRGNVRFCLGMVF